MEFKALHLLVTAPLLSSYLFVSVSCVTSQCSSSTDCTSCIADPSCTWTKCIHESVSFCYNSSLKNEKPQNCTILACQGLSSAVQSKIQETTTAHSAGKETSTTETSTVIPVTVTVPTTATQASQSTTASHVTHSTASTAPMIVTTPKSTITSTTLPPLPTGVSNSTSQTHTASTFDTGSFVGGMVLALSLTVILYLGYKFSCSRQEIRYRTIEEHDAII